jgi:arylsulfatase A-like enzyme
MKRPRLPITAGLLLLTALAAGFISHPEPVKRIFSGSPKHYNVIYIVVDALRADHLGCYGYQRKTSPNIDRLAQRGIVFEKAFAPLPMTQPSFATQFTSLYPVSHGIFRNDSALSPKAITLAEILSQHGWETAAIVGASNLDSVFGLNQGFQVYEDAMGYKMNPEIKTIDHMRRWERRADEVTRIAFRWLDHRKSSKNFFLLLHYYDPHKPYHPPAPFDSMYDRGTDQKTEWNALYDGEVAFADQQLGLLFAKLESMNIFKNTLVVITADHGEGLGDHNWGGHIWKIYDEAVHVPLIWSGPGIPSGKRVPFMVEHVDFTPSILDYLNLPLLPHFQGKSYVQNISTGEKLRQYVLLQKAKPPWNFKVLEPDWDKFPYTQWAIRTEDAKFIWSSDRKYEFYDLKHDPKELNNLFASDHNRAMELFREGTEYRARFGFYNYATPAVRKKGDNDAEEALRALGYLN